MLLERGSRPLPPPTCQCLVTAFQTPILPVWLVAMSWLPTNKRPSTGTPKRNTPSGRRKKRRRRGGTRALQAEEAEPRPGSQSPADRWERKGRTLPQISLWQLPPKGSPRAPLTARPLGGHSHTRERSGAEQSRAEDSQLHSSTGSPQLPAVPGETPQDFCPPPLRPHPHQSPLRSRPAAAPKGGSHCKRLRPPSCHRPGSRR